MAREAKAWHTDLRLISATPRQAMNNAGISFGVIGHRWMGSGSQVVRSSTPLAGQATPVRSFQEHLTHRRAPARRRRAEPWPRCLATWQSSRAGEGTSIADGG